MKLAVESSGNKGSKYYDCGHPDIPQADSEVEHAATSEMSLALSEAHCLFHFRVK